MTGVADRDSGVISMSLHPFKAFDHRPRAKCTLRLRQGDAKLNDAGPQLIKQREVPPPNEDPTTNTEASGWEQKEDSQRCVRAELTLK